MDYPHIAIIDPRTGRLLWRREGWTQQNPVTSEFFAEMAMDFCSRNSFDRAPQPPRPPNTGIASSEASLPAKRQMTELSEDEQMKAAMKASMEAIDVDDDENENEFLDDSDDDDDDNVKVVDSKALGEAKKEPTFNDELQLFAVSEEPNDGSRIQLRTPCGKKAIRKFSGSDPVRAIYAYFAVRWYFVMMCRS